VHYSWEELVSRQCYAVLYFPSNLGSAFLSVVSMLSPLCKSFRVVETASLTVCTWIASSWYASRWRRMAQKLVVAGAYRQNHSRSIHIRNAWLVCAIACSAHVDQLTLFVSAPCAFSVFLWR